MQVPALRKLLLRVLKEFFEFQNLRPPCFVFTPRFSTPGHVQSGESVKIDFKLCPEFQGFHQKDEGKISKPDPCGNGCAGFGILLWVLIPQIWNLNQEQALSSTLDFSLGFFLFGEHPCFPTSTSAPFLWKMLLI